MLFREIVPKELEYVYKMGYKEWPKGRTFERYVEENKKEDEFGSRYVYVDKENNIIGSLIVLSLKIKVVDKIVPLFGLGSIVINSDYRGLGYGNEMIKECLFHIEHNCSEPIFMLFSDINHMFYCQLGFKELPENLQRYPKSVCMVRCRDADYKLVSSLSIDHIPKYF
ncbi:GNAT family N-acetyltransferase [Bacillus sp. T3]|uniref:GNAT family N-acetyltransferase n=1 Tax=Bacillus sp. T3 TaxID=467262 RepID=UPI0029819DED|nr:GNAT family N-acetyltransferase [Bacillus sp. T3]